MDELTVFINTVGFPIVACVFMFMQQKELNKAIMDLTATLKTIDTRLDMLEGKGIN